MDEKLTTSTPTSPPAACILFCSPGAVPRCQLQDAQYSREKYGPTSQRYLLEPRELVLDPASQLAFYSEKAEHAVNSVAIRSCCEWMAMLMCQRPVKYFTLLGTQQINRFFPLLKKRVYGNWLLQGLKEDHLQLLLSVRKEVAQVYGLAALVTETCVAFLEY